MFSLFPVCLCSKQPVSNLHNEKSLSALLHDAEMSTCGTEL